MAQTGGNASPGTPEIEIMHPVHRRVRVARTDDLSKAIVQNRIACRSLVHDFDQGAPAGPDPQSVMQVESCEACSADTKPRPTELAAILPQGQKHVLFVHMKGLVPSGVELRAIDIGRTPPLPLAGASWCRSLRQASVGRTVFDDQHDSGKKEAGYDVQGNR